MKEIVATICSRQKRPDVQWLPAKERYMGEHIVEVQKIARELGKPFYILSGLYGLLPDHQLLPRYEYQLHGTMVEALSRHVEAQICGQGIVRIDFYHKEKPNWWPYSNTIRRAAMFGHAELVEHELTG